MDGVALALPLSLNGFLASLEVLLHNFLLQLLKLLFNLFSRFIFCTFATKVSNDYSDEFLFDDAKININIVKYE